MTEPNLPDQRLRMNEGLATLEVAVKCRFGDLFGLILEVGLLLSSFNFVRPLYGPVVEVPFYPM